MVSWGFSMGGRRLQGELQATSISDIIEVMKNLFLVRIRLSTYFIFIFISMIVVSLFLPKAKFDSAALTLFSVNSFLYGFYIAPILSAQKTRIEEMHKIVRAEANAVFALMIAVKRLPDGARERLGVLVREYLSLCIRQRKAAEGEEKYEEIISYCIAYGGESPEAVADILDKVVANQKNRTDFSMQIANKVYSNEWMVMLVLFGVTLSFILMLDTGENVIFRVLAALVSTGLTMLVVILVKMSTLTHKKAKQIWDPYKRLLETNFYRID